jgi:hypothetical protein
MSIEKNVQVVKDFFAAMGNGDKRYSTFECLESFASGFFARGA